MATLPVVIRSVAPVTTLRRRAAEPIRVGVPLPRGAVTDPLDLSLHTLARVPVALQARATDRWPDGSIRWVLLDFVADTIDGVAEVRLSADRAPAVPAVGRLSVGDASALTVDTGAAVFEFSAGGTFPIPAVRVADRAGALHPALRIDLSGRVVDARLTSAVVVESGPVRVSVEVTGSLPGAEPLTVRGRIDLYAGSAGARVAVTLQNPRRAQHPGGQWILGDAGSVWLKAMTLQTSPAEPVQAVRASLERGEALSEQALPFALLQESSGGDAWDAPVHKTRDGRVVLRFRGYRCQSGVEERRGDRAWPVVVSRSAEGVVGVAVPAFWQNYPAAIAVRESGLTVEFLPADAPSLHELQGGERKTFTAVYAFDEAAVEQLAYGYEPQLLFPPPAWCCHAAAVPFLVPADGDASHAYLRLADLGLDPGVGFIAKRERADEYGWRNFGDLPADHESAFRPPDDPFVSHYNNQYDAVAGFALQFLRTGDRRWWELMDDLARHVRDIDIYHTTEDKAAYNGGLFWHTAHYIDAGRSTHRTYPNGGPAGGGPSAEHNYNTGLMLHAFLTGEDDSRLAAIGLGRWVLNMDDGRQTVFRFLSTGATGHASYTNGYWGPGRGAGHSVLACVVAHRLSGDQAFIAKADELIRRTIHPADDPDHLELLDAERRWSYTAFLQALGVFIAHQTERGVADEGVAHARASLIRYARWMAVNERPYLDHAEALEYPTETWVAQDLRKGDVLLWAALWGPAGQRAEFLHASRRFFADALSTLETMPTRHFTRPLVIVLSHGVRYGWLLAHPDLEGLAQEGSAALAALPRVAFEPQRATALRRARVLAGVGAVTLVALVLVVVFWW